MYTFTPELRNGYDLLLDYGSDLFVASKPAYISEAIKGFTVSAKSFDDSALALDDLRIVNTIYAYKHPESGEVILLNANHSIYIGKNKDDSITCPNQMRTYGAHVDERPNSLFHSLDGTQCIIVDNIKMPLHMKGPLTYLRV